MDSGKRFKLGSDMIRPAFKKNSFWLLCREQLGGELEWAQGEQLEETEAWVRVVAEGLGQSRLI